MLLIPRSTLRLLVFSQLILGHLEVPTQMHSNAPSPYTHLRSSQLGPEKDWFVPFITKHIPEEVIMLPKSQPKYYPCFGVCGARHNKRDMAIRSSRPNIASNTLHRECTGDGANETGKFTRLLKKTAVRLTFEHCIFSFESLLKNTTLYTKFSKTPTQKNIQEPKRE